MPYPPLRGKAGERVIPSLAEHRLLRKFKRGKIKSDKL